MNRHDKGKPTSKTAKAKKPQLVTAKKKPRKTGKPTPPSTAKRGGVSKPKTKLKTAVTSRRVAGKQEGAKATPPRKRATDPKPTRATGKLPERTLDPTTKTKPHHGEAGATATPKPDAPPETPQIIAPLQNEALQQVDYLLHRPFRDNFHTIYLIADYCVNFIHSNSESFQFYSKRHTIPMMIDVGDVKRGMEYGIKKTLEKFEIGTRTHGIQPPLNLTGLKIGRGSKSSIETVTNEFIVSLIADCFYASFGKWQVPKTLKNFWSNFSEKERTKIKTAFSEVVFAPENESMIRDRKVTKENFQSWGKALWKLIDSIPKSANIPFLKNRGNKKRAIEKALKRNAYPSHQALFNGVVVAGIPPEAI